MARILPRRCRCEGQTEAARSTRRVSAWCEPGRQWSPLRSEWSAVLLTEIGSCNKSHHCTVVFAYWKVLRILSSEILRMDLAVLLHCATYELDRGHTRNCFHNTSYGYNSIVITQNNHQSTVKRTSPARLITRLATQVSVKFCLNDKYGVWEHSVYNERLLSYSSI
jgi:hypothetical protein